MKWLTIILFTLLSTEAIAQDPKSERMINHRRAAFTLMSSYFSRILNVVDGEVDYDKNSVIQSARTVEMLSKLPWIGFAPGTEFGDTRAKPEIWLEEDEYLREQQDYCEVWIDDLRNDPQCVYFKQPDNIHWDIDYVYQGKRRKPLCTPASNTK